MRNERTADYDEADCYTADRTRSVQIQGGIEMVGVFIGGFICGMIMGMVVCVLCLSRGDHREDFDG